MAFSLIRPEEMEDVLKRGRGMVIDVREPDYYQEQHYPKARNLPYDNIDVWIRRLPRNRVLILYCNYGSTSLMAARRLSNEGYEVYTVIGGMDAIKRLW